MFGSFFYVFLLSEGSNINQSTPCISLPHRSIPPVLRQQNWGVPEVRNQKGRPMLTNHIETPWGFCIPDHRATPWAATISQYIQKYSNHNTTLTGSAIWVHTISHPLIGFSAESRCVLLHHSRLVKWNTLICSSWQCCPSTTTCP